MSKLGWLTALVMLLIAGSLATAGFAVAPGANAAPHVVVTPAPIPEPRPSPDAQTLRGFPVDHTGPPPQAESIWRWR